MTAQTHKLVFDVYVMLQILYASITMFHKTIALITFQFLKYFTIFFSLGLLMSIEFSHQKWVEVSYG